MRKLMVTGGAGFIGSHFIRHLLSTHPDDRVLNYDRLTYAGNLASLADVEPFAGQRYSFMHGDIADPAQVAMAMAQFRPTHVVNFAAESHNSRAIADPGAFVRTNILGTQVLLEAAVQHQIERFHHVSTDEVYGDLDLDDRSGGFTEESPYRPLNPYSASKASADHLVRAYGRTFNLAYTISNCCNNFGPYQFPEKLIPLSITRLLSRRPLTLYHSSQNRREWLYVIDHCQAIDLILQSGRVGETYNVGSGVEASIEQVATDLLELMGLPPSLKQYVPDRPQHDRRYRLNSDKIRTELGWTPAAGSFRDRLAEVIAWYAGHAEWWQPLLERLAVNEAAWATEKSAV